MGGGAWVCGKWEEGEWWRGVALREMWFWEVGGGVWLWDVGNGMKVGGEAGKWEDCEWVVSAWRGVV